MPNQGCARRRDAQLCASRSRAGACAGAPDRAQWKTDHFLAGRDVPGRSSPDRSDARHARLAAGPVVPTREWRELYGALDCAAVAAIHPFYTACVREFEAAGRKVIGSAPVGHDGTAAWLEAIGAACGVPREKIDTAKNRLLPAIRGALSAAPINGRITLSGYEGSELLVGRVLVESGADLRYVGTACPRTRFNEEDCQWLEAHGVEVRFRASLENDLAAIEEFHPDVAIGTTPVVQKAKELAIPRSISPISYPRAR